MKKLFLILFCLVLTGCAGASDYEITLDNGFRIDRLSAHQIAIYGTEPVKSDVEEFKTHLYVPAKITDVWWNEDYIIAKQLKLVANKNGVLEPPKPSNVDYSYWIIDVNNREPLGPFDEKELENTIDKLGIPNNSVSLTPIEDLR